MKMDKKALKAAALIAVIVLIVFEALSVLVTVIDPSGGLLRIDLHQPLLHVIIVILAIGFGISTYVREYRKNSKAENK